MSQVKVCVTVRQGRALPIVGLSCSMSDRADGGQFGITDSHGMVSAQFPGGSQVRFSVLSKKMKAHKYIGTLQLGPDSIAEQHFTAVVDLIKIEAETQPHPPDSQQTVYPDIKPQPKPTRHSPEGSNPLHPQGMPTSSGTDAQGNPETKVDAQNATLISLEQMQRMWPAIVHMHAGPAKNAKMAELQAIADELNHDPIRFKLDTPLRKAHFFAQVMQEAGPGLEKNESFNYSPKGLIGIFRYFRRHPDEAELYGRRHGHPAEPSSIANRAYSNEGNTNLGNGTVESGDGWKYRGRGYKQVTGRTNYTQLTKDFPKLWPGESINFVETPDLASQPKYAIRSAVWFWWYNGLYKIADKGSAPSFVDEITAIVNNKTNSYNDRRDNFKLTLAIFR